MDGNFKNMNMPNEINDNQNNNLSPNYIPPQVTNDGYFNSQSNNIYSAEQSNITPQTNIYSQNSGSICGQNNINIYTKPENNDISKTKSLENCNPPPPIYAANSNGYFNNQEYIPNITSGSNDIYSPQIINGFSPQTNNNNIASTKINITPVNIVNKPNTYSEPLVRPLNQNQTNKVNNEVNCCSKRDLSMKEITGCQKCLIIGFCIILSVFGFNEIALASTIDSIYYNLVLIMNLSNIVFTIMVSVSILRIKWLRIVASVLSILFLLGSILAYIFQYIKMENNEDPKDNERIGNCKFINVVKIIMLIIIVNIVFYAYWGIRICYRCENLNVSSGSKRTRRRRRRHL